jgi:putative ABC transport system permease protein
VLDGGKEPLQIAVLGVAPRELPERTVFLDISIYQELFSDFQEVDHVEVVSSTPLPTALPPPLQTVDPTDRSAQALRMTEAFRINLRFLSFISLLVTILLIYNTVSYTVLQRRR